MLAEHESETSGKPMKFLVTLKCIWLMLYSRQQKLEQVLNEPSIPAEEKQRKINQTARTESEFLRFLRTQEKPSNYRTIKIIGKGAFGEVKLVERKKDGNIFALKQLVKSEMVHVIFLTKVILAKPSTVQERPTCTRTIRARHSSRV